MSNIFVVGSINMDLVAKLEHVPKRGETILSNSFLTYCGGKGANQATAVAKLGGRVSMIGKVGNDGYGIILKENLAKYDVDVENVSVADCASGIAFISVVDGDNTIVVAPNANSMLSEDDIKLGLENARVDDILITQLEVPLHIAEYALHLAKKKKMKTILNPAPAKKGLTKILQYVDILVPNETETEILTGINPSDDVNTTLAIKALYQLGVGQVVITLGSEGSVVSNGNQITYIDAVKTSVVDTTGAGDTYIGAMAVRLSDNADIISACNYASLAASITVTKAGAAESIPTKQMVIF